jgi:negative regulator of sigma-B (phosphoserine phosphatase)
MRESSVRTPPTPSLIEYGVATLALPGETESGDLHLVKRVGRGVLVCVVDGLGHGAEAAMAAREAVATVDRHADEFLLPLVKHCDEALHGKRGVVMSLAFLDGRTASMTWLGVGNVEGVLLYAHPGARPTRASLVTRGGIVGSELPRLRADVIRVAPGDTLIFATDGIKSGFTSELPAGATPQQLADHILAHFGKRTDDALVLVARYVGAPGAAA